MAAKRSTLRWIACGIFAAALFAAAAPAHAWGHGFGPRVRVSFGAGPFYPHVRYSRFYRPYYYAASPYYYDDYYCGRPYYYASSYYARPYYYGRPYYSFGVRRSFGPRAVIRGHFRGRL
jgi:hypothetical protein